MSVNDLTLAKNLTVRVNDLCVGLETGEAPILEMVTGVTRDLLVWWFAQGHIDAREYNYHPGQRQSILNAIYDAIGVRFKSLPVTPEKVLEALQKKEK